MPQDITIRLEIKSGARLFLAGALGLLSKYLDRKAHALERTCVKVVGDGKR